LTGFLCKGFGYHALIKTHNGSKWFTVLYCLANFFQNFGPNVTTFVIPGEVFPTRYRSTAHGISAASGKFGAVVAQVGFARLQDIGGKGQFIGHMCVSFSPSLPLK
jgi:PHS family inorganic phosphate transporter-like MFS transporter